jgi:hypothetical protein
LAAREPIEAPGGRKFNDLLVPADPDTAAVTRPDGGQRLYARENVYSLSDIRLPLCLVESARGLLSKTSSD